MILRIDDIISAVCTQKWRPPPGGAMAACQNTRKLISTVPLTKFLGVFAIDSRKMTHDKGHRQYWRI